MEYVDRSGSAPIGWVFLADAEYKKWKKQPHSHRHLVTGHAVICGMEGTQELGMVPHNRLWDYYHTLNSLPKEKATCDALEAAFVRADDSPAEQGSQ